METFFDDLDSLIKQHNMLPEQIYNCDETGIQQNEANHYTLAKKGSHPSIVVPTQRSTCTILTCVNASGTYLPPLFIFKVKSISIDNFLEETPDSTMFATDNGFITTEAFKSWMEVTFIKHAIKKRPLLLLYDNHSTHSDAEVLRLAKQNDIIIDSIPPHLSHLYQPLDVGVFSSMKESFKEQNTSFMKEHPNQSPKLKDFTFMLHTAFKYSVTKYNIISGFKQACIVPLNKKAGLEKVQQLSKNSNASNISTSKFGNLFHTQPEQKEKISIKPGHTILTNDEYIKLAQEKKETKEKRKRETEERKQHRQENKKKKEETTQVKVVKQQKKEGIVCSCRSTCNTNKTCSCKKKGIACTKYCSCKGTCSYNNISNQQPSSSGATTTSSCCYSGCKFKDDHVDLVSCYRCKKQCHPKTCTMPSTEKIDGKEITRILCIDCGEKEP